jgi:hypothetical protein
MNDQEAQASFRTIGHEGEATAKCLKSEFEPYSFCVIG